MKQGEMLADLWEHRSLRSAGRSEEATIGVESVLHPLVVVMTAECDLTQDFGSRFSSDRPQASADLIQRDYGHPTLIPYVILCDLYQEHEVRARVAGGDIWRRIRNNQDERYHRLAPASFSAAPRFGEFPDLYADFRKTFAVATEQLYQGISDGGIKRIAVIPQGYTHDLMHRMYGFLSRIGLD